MNKHNHPPRPNYSRWLLWLVAVLIITQLIANNISFTSYEDGSWKMTGCNPTQICTKEYTP